VFQPDKMTRPGKSLIFHIRATRILKVSFNEESKVSTPSFYSSRNTSTRGCKYTSILFPGIYLPGMIMDRINEVCFIHIHGGRLHGIKNTGQIL